MVEKAKAAGTYTHDLTGKKCDVVSIVTIQDIVENHKRIELPQDIETFKAVLRELEGRQLDLDFDAATSVRKAVTREESAEGKKKAAR